MKTTFAIPMLVLTAMAAVACGRGSAVSQPVKAAEARHGDPERGAYLVKIMGCHDCHTPLKMGPKGPEPDFDRALSGHPESVGPLTPKQLDGPWTAAVTGTMTAWTGPWGVSYTANLTPDQNTGLGIWTEDMFVKAIRTGKHMGTSRDILPPMPWSMYRHATDDDLASVFAYLRTIKPITNHVPDPTPPSGPSTTN